MTLTSPSMDNSSAELLPSGDSPLNRRMTESLLASLSEHERAAILSVPAAQNPEDLRMFARWGGAPCGERRAADRRTAACVWGDSWTSFRGCLPRYPCRAGQGSSQEAWPGGGVGPEVCTSWVTQTCHRQPRPEGIGHMVFREHQVVSGQACRQDSPELQRPEGWKLRLRDHPLLRRGAVVGAGPAGCPSPPAVAVLTPSCPHPRQAPALLPRPPPPGGDHVQ